MAGKPGRSPSKSRMLWSRDEPKMSDGVRKRSDVVNRSHVRDIASGWRRMDRKGIEGVVQV